MDAIRQRVSKKKALNERQQKNFRNFSKYLIYRMRSKCAGVNQVNQKKFISNQR